MEASKTYSNLCVTLCHLFRSAELITLNCQQVGKFHLACAYMKMIGKKMDGSGFANILLELNLKGSGELSGKHYEQAMNYHKQLLEVLKYYYFSNIFGIFLKTSHCLACQIKQSKRLTTTWNFLVIICLRH